MKHLIRSQNKAKYLVKISSERIISTFLFTTPCSKKVVHQAHIDNLVNSQRIFKIPSLAHSLENLRENNHQRLYHTQNVSLHYLVKCKLSKIARTEAWQPKTERAGTKENVIMVDEMVLSQQDQPQVHYLIQQVVQAGVIQIIFFMVVLV